MVYVSGFGACRTLLDASLIHFVVNSLSQLKYILGLADQRAYASTFECVRLCSEGKIYFIHVEQSQVLIAMNVIDFSSLHADRVASDCTGIL